MNKYLILIGIIICTGIFGGLVKFFNSIDTSKEINLKELIKYILTGIGAAILIPLFLNMISSDLIKAENTEILNYFIFTGFCFIAAYLSDKFLSTIGDRVLNEVKKVKNRQESTTQTVELLVDNASEPNDPNDSRNSITVQKVVESLSKIEQKNIDDILQSFDKDGKRAFRSIQGIAKEFNYPENLVSAVIQTFNENGVASKIVRRSDGKVLWGLTNLGRQMLNTRK